MPSENSPRVSKFYQEAAAAEEARSDAEMRRKTRRRGEQAWTEADRVADLRSAYLDKIGEDLASGPAAGGGGGGAVPEDMFSAHAAELWALYDHILRMRKRDLVKWLRHKGKVVFKSDDKDELRRCALGLPPLVYSPGWCDPKVEGEEGDDDDDDDVGALGGGGGGGTPRGVGNEYKHFITKGRGRDFRYYFKNPGNPGDGWEEEQQQLQERAAEAGKGGGRKKRNHKTRRRRRKRRRRTHKKRRRHRTRRRHKRRHKTHKKRRHRRTRRHRRG